MALTLANFCGFETGGLEEARAVTNSPTVQTTTVRSGVYALSLAGAASAPTYQVEALRLTAGDNIIGFAYRTTTVIPTNDTDFFIAQDITPNALLRLRLKAVTGNVDLIDSNNVVVGTITAPFVANTWYFIEVDFQDVTFGDAEIFINDVSQLTVTNKDFFIGTAIFALFTGDNVLTQDTFIDDVYWLVGAVASSERYTSLFNVPRTYQNTDEDATDLGDTLADGTWALVGETPVNEGTANDASFTANPATGGTTTDSPSARLGPTGGPTLGTIKGAKWIHRLKRGGGAGTTHYRRYGNSGDGMTDAAGTLTTAFANYVVVSESATIVPLTTESFQYGMRTAGAQDITAADIWAMIANVTAAAPGSGVTEYGLHAIHRGAVAGINTAVRLDGWLEN